MILRQVLEFYFLWFWNGFMDVHMWWKLEVMTSSACVSHTESKTMFIMSVCTALTQLWEDSLSALTSAMSCVTEAAAASAADCVVSKSNEWMKRQLLFPVLVWTHVPFTSCSIFASYLFFLNSLLLLEWILRAEETFTPAAFLLKDKLLFALLNVFVCYVVF